MIRILNQAKFEMRNFRDRPVPRIWPNSGVSAAFENDMVHTMGPMAWVCFYTVTWISYTVWYDETSSIWQSRSPFGTFYQKLITGSIMNYNLLSII